MNDRIVITGYGIVTSLGTNPINFWENIKNGRCGIDYITRFDASQFKIKMSSEVKSFDIEKYYSKKELKRFDLFSKFALYATHQAIENSGLNLNDISPYRMGTILGTGIGGISTIEEGCKIYRDIGPKLSSYYIPTIIPNMAAALIAKEFGFKGPCYTINTACASSNNAIGEAFVLLKNNKLDIVITGGTEAAITPTIVSGFSSMGAMSKETNKYKASIPFDKHRNGFVIGEGAGIIILERLESAIKRNANILAEIVGYSSTCDAYNIVAPSPTGHAAKKAITMAIEEAKINFKDISYINAHGTGTVQNDIVETKVIKDVFQEYAYEIPISSTKSMTGHLLGASGAIEAIICVKALEHQFVPPTIGYEHKDELCDLNYTPNIGHSYKLNYILSNSMGFGGHNSMLIFKKF